MQQGTLCYKHPLLKLSSALATLATKIVRGSDTSSAYPFSPACLLFMGLAWSLDERSYSEISNPVVVRYCKRAGGHDRLLP